MTNQFLAGAGRAEILFAKEDFPLKAYHSQHDPLYVKVLWLKKETDVVIVSIDLTSLPDEAIDHFRRIVSDMLEVDYENVFISVTHSFSSPHIPVSISTQAEQNLSALLYKRIDSALKQALHDAKDTLSKALIHFDSAECHINVNRNIQTEEGYWISQNPNGYSSHTVRTLYLHNDRNINVCLINYDLQSSVMDQVKINGSLQISGDIAGALSTKLAKKDIYAFFLPGCAGDQAPAYTGENREKDGYTYIQTASEQLCQAVYKSDLSYEEGESIQLTKVNVSLPEQKMKYGTRELKPHLTYEFEKTGNKITTFICDLCVNGIHILMTSPELNSSFGQKIREQYDENTMIVTLVNGACKYLPEKEDYEKITYTAMNTKIGQGSDQLFLEAVQRLKKEGKA